MDIRFGAWNVSSLYRLGSQTASVRELAKYKLDLLGVQEVRWDKEGTARLRWAGHVARMGERRGLYRVLVGKREGRR